MIIRSLSLSSLVQLYKNFNVAHYSSLLLKKNKRYKHLTWNTNHDKVQLQGKGHKFESYIFGVIPFFN